MEAGEKRGTGKEKANEVGGGGDSGWRWPVARSVRFPVKEKKKVILCAWQSVVGSRIGRVALN